MPSPMSKPKYRPLTGIYSDQLNAIWANDLRIPSPASRKAWAVARGLNPHSVHNWWYRRRPRAKKMRIRIPSGTYELEVGRVPTPPATPPPKVKEEALEPTICVDPVTEDGTVDNPEQNEDITTQEWDVCGPMNSDGLRLWTEDDELEELRSSIRPSSPFSGSFFPSSDLDDFFGTTLSSVTTPSSPALGHAEISCDRDEMLPTRPSSPVLAGSMKLDDSHEGPKSDLQCATTAVREDLASLSSDRRPSGNDTCEPGAPVSDDTGTCTF